MSSPPWCIRAVDTVGGTRPSSSAFELVRAVPRWQAVGVRTYGQYCPIARTSELLAERWTMIILRNILVGCQTFNEIADGAPGLSRGLLSKRLRELERAGIIEICPKPDGHGSTYEPTQAGQELSELMLVLERWGRRWAELKPEHAHPGVVLWVWANFFLDRDRLPRRRTVVRFEYPTLPGSARVRPLAHRTDPVAGRPARRGHRGARVPGAGPGASKVEPARLVGRRPTR